jgi:hypothetical protein
MVLRLKKLAARSGSSAALHRFIGHIQLSVLSGNTCVLPTLTVPFHNIMFYVKDEELQRKLFVT